MNEINQFNPAERPNSVEAEQQILGALLNANERYHKVSGLLEPGHFYDPVHARIFETIVHRIEDGKLASPVTLKTIMGNDTGLQELGGPAYLARLAGAAISAFAIRDYAEMIVDLADKRELQDTFTEAQEQITRGIKPAGEIAIDVETRCGSVASTSSNKPLIRSHLSSIAGALDQINEAYMNTAPPGVASGIPALDRKLSNLRPGQLIVIAGRPAMGKSSCALNIAYNAAKHERVGVFFGTLEMSGEENANRMLSKGLAERGKRIPYTKMIGGRLSEDEFRAVVDEAKAQESLPLFIGERDVREIGKFRAAVRRAQQHFADTPMPLGIVFVDYIQQMQASGFKSAYDRVSAASDALKTLAMELNLPVVAMAQLNRSVEMRDPPIPMLSDLRESGKLEEDADVVIFCYRPEYYIRKKLDAMPIGDAEARAPLEDAFAASRGQIDLIIDKQRSGSTGTARAYIDLPCCHMTPDRSNDAEALI